MKTIKTNKYYGIRFLLSNNSCNAEQLKQLFMGRPHTFLKQLNCLNLLKADALGRRKILRLYTLLSTLSTAGASTHLTRD